MQGVKRLPAMWEAWVRSLGQEDPLEKEMATHSSILAWRIPWTEELGGLQSTGRKESDTTERLHFHFHLKKNRQRDSIRRPLQKSKHEIMPFSATWMDLEEVMLNEISQRKTSVKDKYYICGI